jgi:hypothetical protein
MSLVYKLSISVKTVDNTTFLAKTIPVKGFFVLTYTDSDSNLVFADANLIMYGKNVLKNKVYVELDYSTVVLDLDIWTQGKGRDYEFINLLSHGTNPFNFSGLMFGKQKETDIGGGIILTDCIRTYKGNFSVYNGMLLDSAQGLAGTGTITASLWTSFTKNANNFAFTQDRVIQELKTVYLADYGDATPVP